eukprot:2241421-Rhodomonas_salina.3
MASVLPNGMIYPPAALNLIECSDIKRDQENLVSKSMSTLAAARCATSVQKRWLEACTPFLNDLNLALVADTPKVVSKGCASDTPTNIGRFTVPRAQSETSGESRPDVFFVLKEELHPNLQFGAGAGIGIGLSESKGNRDMSAFRQAAGGAI